MSYRNRRLVDPPRWSNDQLAEDRKTAIEQFRTERLTQQTGVLSAEYDQAYQAIDDVLEGTQDLINIEAYLREILADQRRRDAFRYLATPPLSEDDWKTLAETESLAVAAIGLDAELMERLVSSVLADLDSERFPWVHAQLSPTEKERHAARLATAVMMVAQRIETRRRNEGKKAQEGLVAAALIEAGFKQITVPHRHLDSLASGPQAGEFSTEVELPSRDKADFVIGLWDRRHLLIECKVSNSETNSIKRLIRETGGKASKWLQTYGEANVIPAAVISGVFKLRHLQDAQEKHKTTLFWAHNLAALTNWIETTRPAGQQRF